MATKITSPIEGFSEPSTFGTIVLQFKDGVAETDAELAPGLTTYLERRGYTVEAGEAEPQGPFDPTKANADAVAEYVAAEDITAEEVQRVLDAEKAGKARKGVTEALQARLESFEGTPAGDDNTGEEN